MNDMILRGAGGGKSGGGSGGTPVEAPDSLHSTAYARLVDGICEGEIGGLVNGLQSIFFQETPLQNSDGSFNFKNVQIESRTGTQNQDPLVGFPAVENEIGYGVPIINGTPIVRALTNTDLSGISVRIATSGMLKTDLKTGNTDGYKVDYTFELSTDGGAYQIIYYGAITGKTTQLFERSHRIDLPPSTTGWSIRISRTTPETTASNIQDEIQLTAITEVIDAKLRYSNTAVIGVSIDASQFNSIPTRAYEVYLRIIKVPSNYNPTTRVYTGIWDGTFQPLWSDNPAWCYYDMLTNDRFGLGHMITPSMVDKWSLYAIGQYCDEPVDDGKGGTEPRFTCNIYFQSKAEAYKVLQDMASVFRGLAFYAAGTVIAVQDRPTDPVYTYTNSNVIDGKFVYSGTSKRTRATVALVAWSDPNDFYRGKVQYVPDRDGIARYGVQSISITAIGCTSQGQANRVGMWALLSARLLTDTVSFGVGLEGTIAAPGQHVRVFDEYRAGLAKSGRVSAATASVVTPDRMPIAVIGDSLTVNTPAGLSETRTISAVGASTITVSPAYSAAPLVDAQFGVESSALNAQLFRIVSTNEGSSDQDNIQFDIVALQHNQSLFDAVDFGYTIDVPSTSMLPSKIVSPPASVTITDYETVVDFLPRMVAVIEWPAVENAKEYQVWWKINDGEWSPAHRVNAIRYEIDNAHTGIYRAKVCSVGNTGIVSRPIYSILTIVSPGTFASVLEVFSVAGVLVINCALSEQFLVQLTENITSLQFINVPSQKTLILEVRNPASWGITVPPSIVPVSGIPYVVSGPGTALIPKIDTLGLQTETAGVLWALRVDMDDSPATGGGGGSFSIGVVPVDAYGHAASSPFVGVTATPSGGTAPITVAWDRAAGGVGDWGGSTTNVGGPDFSCSTPTGLSPTFSRTGSADGYVAQNWRVIATDSLGLTCQAIIEVTLEDDGVISGGGGGPLCVWAEAYMPDGRKARDVKVGTRTIIVEPTGDLPHRPGLISYAKLGIAECFLLRCENGVELTCSDTAPIPTRDGLVLAPNMLDHETVTLLNGQKSWSRVVVVLPQGILPVMHITCEDACFLAGNVKGQFMAHHNIKWEPDGSGTGGY